MIGNTQIYSVFRDIKILISLALIAITALGCSLSTEPETPELPEFPDIPELPLSEASDRARVERTLPWTEIVKTCSGIDSAQPITEFATVAGTSQQQSTENLKVNEYAGEVWVSSRLLVEGHSDDFRSFYLVITYLTDQGFASLRLERLEPFDYEITRTGTALIARSRAETNPGPDGRSGTQVFIFDGLVVSNVVGMSSAGAQPYCSDAEMFELAEQLAAGIR